MSDRAKARGLAGGVVTLKLKRADHTILTRRQTLDTPSRMADRIYRVALPMLRRDIAAGPFRLLGVGISGLVAATAPEPSGDLLDPLAGRRVAAELAADRIRARFGRDSSSWDARFAEASCNPAHEGIF